MGKPVDINVYGFFTREKAADKSRRKNTACPYRQMPITSRQTPVRTGVNALRKSGSSLGDLKFGKTRFAGAYIKIITRVDDIYSILKGV